MKADTKKQLGEFSASLEKMAAGDLSLLSDLAAVRLVMTQTSPAHTPCCASDLSSRQNTACVHCHTFGLRVLDRCPRGPAS